MRTVNELSLDELRTIISAIQDTINGLIRPTEILDVITDILREYGLAINDRVP